MRSTEQSGVEAKRFHARNAERQSWVHRAIAPVLHFIATLTPVTRAVATTAFAAATLFLASEVVRTIGRPAEEIDLGASLLSCIAAFAAAFVVAGFSLRRNDAGAAAELARYCALIETLPFGVACWSAEARLVASNQRFAERLKISPGRLVPGATYHEVVKLLAQGGYMQSVREDWENRLLELHREDGSTLLLEERPLAGAGFVTLVMDVTESRRTNQLLTSIREEQRLLARRYHEEKLRAEAASRSKTSFLAHLSHDIRTPLNHIIGFADMLRQQPYGPLGDPRYLNYVEAVKGSGERLLGFFASILELAELEGGRRELKRDRFTADELLIGTLRRFSGQAQRAGLTMGLGSACEALLTGDRFAIERMLANLVDNAMRFTPRGGKVTLAAYAAADGVVIEITDTGIGMAGEKLQSLSQPFVFGDAALTRDRDGAGLGIAISRAIAELSGGHLAIDSRLGLGTTVAVSLPLKVEEEAKAA